MGHQLNIKNPETCALAAELAQLTGESVTAAVTQALRERLQRERAEHQRREEDVEARVAKVMTLAREIVAHVEPGTTSDTNWLYDEAGFPR